MAASGALGPFLSTMLGLRAQRLQEEEIKAKMAQQQQEELMKGIQAAGSAFTSSMKDFKADQSANELATEYFGKPVMRAQSADKGVQGAADLAASQMPGGLNSKGAFGTQFTGGKEGLAQRIQLEQLKDTIQKGKQADIWKQKNYDLAERNTNLRAAAETRQANKGSYANQLMEKAPQSAKDILTTSLAVQAKQDTLMEQMQKDMANNDFDSYQAHAREMQAYQEVHKSAKLTSALKDTPPFVSAKQAKLFADLNAAGSPQDLTEAQQAIEESPLKSSPLTYGPKVAPATQTLDPAMLQRMAQGGQFTPQEAQQVTGMAPPAPAPGARPTIVVNKKTKERGVWNYQTGKVDPLPTGQ